MPFQKAVRTDPSSVQSTLPRLYDLLLPYVSRNGSDDGGVASEHVETDSGDWEWNDGSDSPTASIGTFDRCSGDVLEARLVVEAYVGNMIESLEVVLRSMLKCARVSFADESLTSAFIVAGLFGPVCKDSRWRSEPSDRKRPAIDDRAAV